MYNIYGIQMKHSQYFNSNIIQLKHILKITNLNNIML